MPAPAKISLLPFIKELFFNKQSVVEYIKRNRLITGLFFAVIILVLANLFITEQAIRLSNSTQNNVDNTLLHQEIAKLKNALSTTSGNEAALSACLLDKQRLEKVATQSTSRCPSSPKRPTNHPRDSIVVLPQRETAEDSLRKKLDAIRVD